MNKKYSMLAMLFLLLAVGFNHYVNATTTQTDWPMFHMDLSHTGYSTSTEIPLTNQMLWRQSTEWEVIDSATVANGIVYICSELNVNALNAATGARIWSHGLLGNVGSCPAVADGVVYVGNYRSIDALNAATGALIWSHSLGSVFVDSSPVVANGVVYVGSNDHNVYALDAATGATNWSFATGNQVKSSPSVVGGVVYVGSLDGKVYAIDAATSVQIWSYTTGGPVYSSPAVANGLVFVGSTDHSVYALNAATGEKVWSYATGNVVYSSPAVANGLVYVGSYDGYLYALDAATGVKEFGAWIGAGIYSSPAVADGVVYLGGGNNNVYALNALTGAQIWTYATGGSVYSSPAIAGGVVYVGSADHYVYALGTPRSENQLYLLATSAYGSPTPASGWFDQGTTITESVDSPVAGPDGLQYVCTGWTGTGSVPSSGTGSSVTFTLAADSSICWQWTTKQQLTIMTDDLPSTSPTNIYLGGSSTGSGTAYDESPFTALFDTGINSGTIGVDSTVGPYHFTGWSDASTTNPHAGLQMSASRTLTANYADGYTVTFTESGLADSNEWGVTFNGVTQTSTTSTITFTGVALGTGYSYSISTVGVSDNERYTPSPDSGTLDISSDTTQGVTFYHQYGVLASYSTSDHSTPSDTVILWGYQDGVLVSIPLTQDVENIWLDSGTLWQVNYLILSQSSTERWYYGYPPLSGHVGPSTTIDPQFYHLYVFHAKSPNDDLGYLEDHGYANSGISFRYDSTYMGTFRSNVQGWTGKNRYMNPSMLWGAAADAGTTLTIHDVQAYWPAEYPASDVRYRYDGAQTGSITVDSSQTIQFNYITQYQFTAQTSGLPEPNQANIYFGGSSSGGGTAYDYYLPTFFDKNTYTGTIGVDSVVGSYNFAGWSDGTTANPHASVLMSEAKTLTANYVYGYTVTFTESGLADSNEWSVTFNGITHSSTTSTITFTGVAPGTGYSYSVSTVGVSGNERYVSSPDSGTLDVSSDTPRSITYYHQHKMTLSYSITGGGSPTTASTFTANQLGSSFSQPLTTTATDYWFDSGSIWSVSNRLGSGHWWQQFVLASGDTGGEISAAGTINFNYYNQYSVSVRSLKDEAYFIGATFQIDYTCFGTLHSDSESTTDLSIYVDASSTVTIHDVQTYYPDSDGVSGLRYRYNDCSIIGSGAIASFPMSITGVTRFQLNYVKQYEVDFSATGLDGGASSNAVLTLGGTGYAWNALPRDVWVDSGTIFTWESPVSGGTGKQFVKTEESGASPIVAAGTYSAAYQKQWKVTFTATGLASDAGTNTVFTLGATNYLWNTLPSGVWVNDGTTFTWKSPISGGAGIQFVKTSQTGNSPVSGDAYSAVYHKIVLVLGGAASAQYSDPATITATLTDNGNPVVGKSIVLWIGTQSTTATTDGSGVATGTITLTQPAGGVTTKAIVPYPTALTTLTIAGSFTITKEDAILDYKGDLSVITAGTTGAVRLSVHLTQDDTYLGNLAYAKVHFILTPDTGSPIVISNVPVVPSADGKSGDALTTASVPVGNWFVSFTIESANIYWTGGDEVIIDVIASTAKLMVTGGGWVTDTASMNNKGNFGFTVNYQKNGAPKGNFMYLFRATDGYNYLIKSNSWSDGGLSFTSTNTAFFTGRCTVQVIDRKTGTTVNSFGNYRFTVDLSDDGQSTPKADKFGLKVWDPATGTTYKLIAPVIIGGGNIVIHSK
ncbi:MAG: PQQ-binding-like beta-propeller repeat protein [Candidatus Bathyarchaeota archaeon]|nr:PQQ-binding-like beta-propeller repeat protein [Candidatus Bathyarchaeota archaeon]